jgi:hypothetical protein
MKKERRNKVTAKGHAVTRERLLLANKLFHDDCKTFFKIAQEDKISIPVLERIVFPTRGQWIQFKQKEGLI